MFITDELAEVLGVLLGDGCVSRSLVGRNFYYQVAFTGNASEFRYYETIVKPTLESNFGVEGRLFMRSDNTTRYHIAGERLARELFNLGIPLGKKHDACIPPAVLKAGLVVPFIRGFYHAEGSIYHRYSKIYNRMKKVYDNLFVIQIRTKLPTLMRQLYVELRKLGIATNKLIAKDGVYTIRITRQSMIQKFFDIIRPRYKLWPRQFFNPP